MRDWCQRFYHVFTCFKKKFVHVFNVFNFFPTFLHLWLRWILGLGFQLRWPWQLTCGVVLLQRRLPSNLASETVLLELVRSKWVPTLFCGLEYYQLSNADLRSLYFTFNRLFTKLFKTKSIDVVKSCQSFSGSEQWRIQGGRGAMPPPNQTKIIFFAECTRNAIMSLKWNFFLRHNPCKL